MNRPLNISRKTGFKILDPTIPVNIRDFRGILFYTTESMVPLVKQFNLPAGEYMIDSGSFKPMLFPVKFKLAELPTPERLALPPYNFTITFATNPNKCSIFWKEKIIVFDDSFIDHPLPDLFFIYLHEMGHSRYGYDSLYSAEDAEAFCDLYAANKMLEMGFNPSQIDAAPKNTLSHRQDYRKEYIQETLLDNSIL